MSNRLADAFKQLQPYFWTGSTESAMSEAELCAGLETASRASFSFYFMLALASVIATLGLLENSAATIIGAMIIAPLMNPILALAYALIVGNRQWCLRSFVTVANGALLTIAIAWLLTTVLTVSVVDSEVIARTQPTLLDMAVALAAGAAGGFANTRRSIANSIAGVAIAVALVPPLSVLGIGLALGSDAVPGIGLSIGHNGLAFGATLLFLTNLVAIVLASGLVFASQGYGSIRSAIVGLTGWLAIAVIIFFPLGQAFTELLLTNVLRSRMRELSRSGTLDNSRLLSYSVDLREDGTLYIEMEGISNRDITSEDVEAWRDSLANYMGRPIHLKVRWIPVSIEETDVDSPSH
ncbi:MAG: DUF389 domain-containing protein [Cyanobacteria bacterium P01_A01_bin.3]